jgi:hypothetical protein
VKINDLARPQAACEKMMDRKNGSAIGLAICVFLLCSGSPQPAAARNFVVHFGELQASDYQTVVPTQTIKQCEKSTGYRFGIEINPQDAGAYEYHLVIHLPAPPQVTSFNNPVQSSSGGQVIKIQPIKANGHRIYERWVDKGDPLGSYKIEVFVQNSLVESVDYKLVGAQTCLARIAAAACAFKY